ncbi:LysR family transcriptional regulator [Roseovarius aquimarinus]|uniref:LysR family transcriptional regulator n=1 Tax=Roseovarius aquimarinus TaxID=1229156 RepID=A0ABW7IBU7_9RHOB
MQDLKPVRVFLEVVARRSFAAAAKSLRMTPASVSRIVAKLEEDLGEQLLLRTTRQVSLTSTGASIAARYAPLLEAFDQVARDLEREMQPHRGRLAINAPMSFGQRILPGLIESFRLAYPNIDLTIRLTDRLVDIVTESCDLAIRVSAPPTDKSTIWRKLCEVPLRIVAAPSFLERHGVPEEPGDLDPALCLSYGEEDAPESWRFEKDGVPRHFRAGRAIQTNNGDLLYQLVRSGAGIAMLPEFLVAEGMKTGEVVPLLGAWSLPPLWLSLFYPPYETLPPQVATFTDFFEAYLRDLDAFDLPR